MNWDAYYESYPVPAWIGRRMTRAVLGQLRGRFRGGVVVEIGGGDSHLYQPLTMAFPTITAYHVIDPSSLGCARFLVKAGPGAVAHVCTVEGARGVPLADLVVSAGVIEHSDPAGTAVLIAQHGAHAKPGGLVQLSWPLATWPYWVTRTLATWAGRFSRDLFERPLTARDVRPQLERLGRVLAWDTLWLTGLTQAVALVRVAG